MDELNDLIAGAIAEQSVDMTVTKDPYLKEQDERYTPARFRRVIKHAVRSLERDYYPYK